MKRPGPAPATRREYIERFWSYVKPVGECWEWQGSTDSNGYGQYSLKTPEKFGFPGRTVKAYAFAWVIENGQVPAGMQLDHLCRNRICVKTAHLEVVTPRENSLRGTSPAAINAVKTHCKHGHLFDSVNTYVDRKGRRVCRTCHRIRQRNRKALQARDSGRPC